MLAFLDALCAALFARDAAATRELLAHPLATTLPAEVIAEARQVLEGEERPHAAPLQTLRLYHQTAHVLGMRRDPATRGTAPASGAARGEHSRQMELPLRAKVA